ncbi:MAG: hypothetical protein KIT80_23030 [Chitinophagaceae bacterium]|nr:hypothetical protein [Chitinophagaceae bacterium]MCW5929813.1 hypothetical protein [Chitinophagaceae bacterium]
MASLKIAILTAILTCSIDCYAWRIEKNILIIEKGDNLFDISHSLLGKGILYDSIWKMCIDTLASRNPNKVYDGMRFRIDSLLTAHNDYSTKVYFVTPETPKNEDSAWSWKIDVGDLLGLLGVIVGALLANKYLKQNEIRKKELDEINQKKQMAFDLLREFNSSEIHLHRIKADYLIVKNNKSNPKLFRNTDELKDITDERKRSLFAVMNFYKQLELLIESNKVDATLMPTLFGEIFYYWWFNCFKELYANSTEPRWQLLDSLSSLYSWFEKNSPEDLNSKWKSSSIRSSPQNVVETTEPEQKITININYQDLEQQIKKIVNQVLTENNNKGVL